LIYYEGEEDALAELTSLLPFSQGCRVVFCAKEGHTADFQKQLVSRLRVTAILQQPIDPDELVRRASIELDAKVPSSDLGVLAQTTVIPKALLPVWHRHQETNRERVEVLVTVCAEEDPSEEWLEGACRAAHQLAGSLGTFGLHAASLLARDAERLFKQYPQLSPEQRVRLGHVISDLQLQVEDPQLKLPSLEEAAPKGSLLVFSIDPEWSEAFAKEAIQAGYRPLVTDDPTGARRVFALQQPECGVLDLSESGQDGLFLIHDLGAQGRPFVGLVDNEAAGLGIAARILTKPVTAAEIFRALEEPVAAPDCKPRRVLAVDDDEIVLETLSALLPALNLEVHVLSDPLRFWETLEQVDPDLVFLDVDLPYVGGVELCRAMRSEPRYFDVPVIFMSAYHDTETVQRVFAAGADDYVFKPITGAELITRTRNRLRRARLAAREVDDNFGHGASVGVLIQDEAFRRNVIRHCADGGVIVEQLPDSGDRLVERLTCEVERRPRVVVLDVLASNPILESLEGLGVNNYCQVWVRGNLNEEDIQSVYEWGLAGYLPESLAAEVVARKILRLRQPGT
jgi:DNA-binding response OmpR family regulator/HPt (histidine-containing phosphotransfer) domain-containing protein